MLYLTHRLVLGLLLLFLLLPRAQAQQFAGTSASNSSTETLHNEDVFRDFKDEDYSASMFQPKWFKKKLLGYAKSQWSVGILADGDFSRALTDKSVAPRTGQLGINAIKFATLYQLKKGQKFKSNDELVSLFEQHRRRAISYDSLRGELSWRTFDDNVRKWRGRLLTSRSALQQRQTTLRALQDNNSKLKRGELLDLPAYRERMQARLEQRNDALSKAQQARDAYQPRYRRFATVLQQQYQMSPELERDFRLTESKWLGLTFPTRQELAQLKQKYQSDSLAEKSITLALQQAIEANQTSRVPALRTRAARLTQTVREEHAAIELFETPFALLSQTYKAAYLDTLATEWTYVRSRYQLLQVAVDTAQRVVARPLPFTNTEFNQLVNQLQRDNEARLLVQQDSVVALTQRVDLLNKLVELSDLPFEKIRYRNRIELNMIISLGNELDSIRARGRLGPPPVITNRALFGSNLLVPGSAVQAGRAISVNVIINPFTPLRPQQATLGLHGYFNYSSTRWSLPAAVTSANASDTTYQVGIFSLATGVQYTLFDISASTDAAGHREGNNVKLALQADFVYRNLGGELGRPRHRASREAILGTARRDYLGFQPAVVASIDNFRVTFSYPIFPKEIPGFSNGYPVVGFGFSGNLQAGRSKPSGVKPWRRLFAGKEAAGASQSPAQQR